LRSFQSAISNRKSTIQRRINQHSAIKNQQFSEESIGTQQSKISNSAKNQSSTQQSKISNSAKNQSALSNRKSAIQRRFNQHSAIENQQFSEDSISTQQSKISNSAKNPVRSERDR
jgi:hypothetical protein